MCAISFLVPVGMHVPLMYLQPAVEEERLPAQITHERFSGAVDEHVRFQLVVVGEALATLLAGERLLSCVNAKVPLQVVIQTESCSTDVTGEGFLPGVDDAVSLQSSAGPVRAVAHSADERRDACVFPLMHSQGVCIFESLFTHWAFVFFGVRVDHLMEAKGVFTLELLPTCCTAERPFLRVSGHMTFQVHRRLESLVTHLTLQQLLRLLVAQEVVFQRLLNSECFATLIAGKRFRWLYPLVTLEMILKRLLFPVRSLTARTRVGQGGFTCLMTQKVIFQRLLFKETSATLLTRKMLLVDLCVFLQFTFPVKADVTVLTGETLHCLFLLSFSLHSTRLAPFFFSVVVSGSWKWREIMYKISLLILDFILKFAFLSRIFITFCKKQQSEISSYLLQF